MKDRNQSKPYLELLTSEGTRKNDVIMFSFIFAIILYIAIFVPNSPVSGNNEELYTNEQIDASPHTEQQYVDNAKTEATVTAAAMQ